MPTVPVASALATARSSLPSPLKSAVASQLAVPPLLNVLMVGNDRLLPLRPAYITATLPPWITARSCTPSSLKSPATTPDGLAAPDEYILAAANPPEPLPRRMPMPTALAPLLTARSILPSRSKSPAARPLGVRSAGTESRGRAEAARAVAQQDRHVVAARVGGGHVELAVGIEVARDQRLRRRAALCGTSPQALVLADFNADGKLDLAAANAGSNNVSILLGNGAGRFGTATKINSGGSTPNGLAAGDFDRDGNTDLAVSNGGSAVGIGILRGNGSGGFAAAEMYSSGAANPSGIVAGDFNDDGGQDLAVIHGGNVAVMYVAVSGAASPSRRSRRLAAAARRTG